MKYRKDIQSKGVRGATQYLRENGELLNHINKSILEWGPTNSRQSKSHFGLFWIQFSWSSVPLLAVSIYNKAQLLVALRDRLCSLQPSILTTIPFLVHIFAITCRRVRVLHFHIFYQMKHLSCSSKTSAVDPWSFEHLLGSTRRNVLFWAIWFFLKSYSYGQLEFTYSVNVPCLNKFETLDLQQ